MSSSSRLRFRCVALLGFGVWALWAWPVAASTAQPGQFSASSTTIRIGSTTTIRTGTTTTVRAGTATTTVRGRTSSTLATTTTIAPTTAPTTTAAPTTTVVEHTTSHTTSDQATEQEIQKIQIGLVALGAVMLIVTALLWRSSSPKRVVVVESVPSAGPTSTTPSGGVRGNPEVADELRRLMAVDAPLPTGGVDPKRDGTVSPDA